MLHHLCVRLELDLVIQLVLHLVLHLSLDLGSLFLSLTDELRHSIVCGDKDAHSTLEQLSLNLLIRTLILLSIKLKLQSLDLADEVGLLVRVGEEKSFVLRDLALKEVGLTSDMTHLIADTFISVGTLASQLSLLLAELSQGLLIDIGLLVEVNRKLFNVIDNESIRCHLDLVSLDPELAQLSFHVE